MAMLSLIHVKCGCSYKYELPPPQHTHPLTHTLTHTHPPTPTHTGHIGGTTRTPLTLITIANQKHSVPCQNSRYARLMAPPTTSGGAQDDVMPVMITPHTASVEEGVQTPGAWRIFHTGHPVRGDEGTTSKLRLELGAWLPTADLDTGTYYM